jgi:hypothetical protein
MRWQEMNYTNYSTGVNRDRYPELSSWHCRKGLLLRQQRVVNAPMDPS